MYIFNGVKIKEIVLIGDVNYPINYFDGKTDIELSEMGVTKLADPTLPDLNIYNYIENSDGSLNITVKTQLELDNKKSEHIDKMWNAAHACEISKVNGSAVGLITIGILTGKPKCIAVQNWIKSIWTLYYTRKYSITEVENTALYDFSSIGDMPHSIPELMQELGM
jgi:hypothetical protein